MSADGASNASTIWGVNCDRDCPELKSNPPLSINHFTLGQTIGAGQISTVSSLQWQGS